MSMQVQIVLTLCPMGPVLVSSGNGNKLHPELPDNTFLMGRSADGETYVIPGSSLKGVIRHFLYKHYPDNDVDELFGYIRGDKSIKSRISISDAYADMKSVKTTIRYSTAIDGVTQSAGRGSLNNMQAVIKGDFPCNIRLRNVSEKELMMVMTALQGIVNGEICVGGKIGRGFGRMSIPEFGLTAAEGYDEDLAPKIIGEYDSLQTALTAIREGCFHGTEL